MTVRGPPEWGRVRIHFNYDVCVYEHVYTDTETRLQMLHGKEKWTMSGRCWSSEGVQNNGPRNPINRLNPSSPSNLSDEWPVRSKCCVTVTYMSVGGRRQAAGCTDTVCAFVLHVGVEGSQ